MEGLVAWTTDGAYELRQYLAPEAIFFQLIVRARVAIGKPARVWLTSVQSNEMSREADALGKTVGLDLLSLYEEVLPLSTICARGCCSRHVRWSQFCIIADGFC